MDKFDALENVQIGLSNALGMTHNGLDSPCQNMTIAEAYWIAREVYAVNRRIVQAQRTLDKVRKNWTRDIFVEKNS